MPRRKTVVKNKSPRIGSGIGAIDLHFHGAFGIDLMIARSGELDLLSRKLWQKGVAGFCATTLSVDAPRLEETVGRLGSWIRTESYRKEYEGAIPLGIHLEGPYLHPEAAGAHPGEVIRPLDFQELNRLWDLSQETLKVLTFAPELLPSADLRRLARWAESRSILLSLGHSRATEAQTRKILEQGIRGVTHAWNAMPFHHRGPGPLGAALGHPETSIEVIIDGVHVAPSLIEWARKIHGRAPLCFVSDCAPAAATGRSSKPGPWCSFGPLQVRWEEGACRLTGGHLAGGGLLLPDAFKKLAQLQAGADSETLKTWTRQSLRHLTTDPLRALGISPSALRDRRGSWYLSGNSLTWSADRR